MYAAADHPTLGLKDRAGARVAVAPFRQSSNSCLGLEPACARSSRSEHATCPNQEAKS
jgi:hypothetical protein